MKETVKKLNENIRTDGEFKSNLWENYGKSRIYVARNNNEKAGYITKDEVKGQNTGNIKGWNYAATRPGNIGTLRNAIEIIEKVEEVKEEKIIEAIEETTVIETEEKAEIAEIERGQNRRGIEFVKYEEILDREEAGSISVEITLFKGKFLQICVTGGPKNGAFYIEEIKEEKQVKREIIIQKYKEYIK